MIDRDRLEHEISLHDTIRELRRENGRITAALTECHKEIFKTRNAMLAFSHGEDRVLSHEEVARELIVGHAAQAPEHLAREIAKALQRAFDLGFRAAGGSVAA